METTRRGFFQIVIGGITLALALPTKAVQVEATKAAIIAQDLKNAKLLDPGWYRCTIDSISESVSQTGDRLIKMHYTDIDSGKQLVQGISERFPTPILDILKKCEIITEPYTESTLDLEQCIGKEVNVRVVLQKYQERIFNAVSFAG